MADYVGAADEDPQSSILLVDTDRAISAELREYIEQQTDRPVTATSDLDTARTRLAADPIDCVLLALDPLEEHSSEFVDDARTISPDIPLIGLTTHGPETLSEPLVSHITTIVEYANDPANWAFLAEKIRSNRETGDRTSDDYELYRMFVESAQDGLYRLNANGDVVYANDSWAEMLGYTRGEILGIHASRAMADGELERGQRVIQQVLEDEDRDSDLMDLEMVTQDGERLIVSVRFVVLTTEDGTYDGIMGVARDVTERRAREDELERKNERLEQFASIVSHDLRNPLTIAQGRVELAREEHDSEHLEAAERAHDRIQALIEDLLTLSREGKTIAEMQWIDLEAFVRKCWKNIEQNGATLEAKSDQKIRADSSRLRQLLENLMRNAIVHGGENVTVTIGNLEGGQGFYVADDGPGIPPKDRDHIFESGYSTRESGTGFGLSIVRQVAEAHGWSVDVVESVSGGTRFEIRDVEVQA